MESTTHLSVIVEELAVGVDQVDNDGVVHDVVLVLVLRARREVDPALKSGMSLQLCFREKSKEAGVS